MVAKNTRPNIYGESDLMFTLSCNVWINGRPQVLIRLLMEDKVVQLLCVETTLQFEHDVDDLQHPIPAHAEHEMDVDHIVQHFPHCSVTEM